MKPLESPLLAQGTSLHLRLGVAWSLWGFLLLFLILLVTASLIVPVF